MQAVRKKFTISDKQQPSCVVYALYILIAAADSAVECHDRCHGTVDFLCGFFLVRLDVSGWVGADEDVVHHPAKDGVSTVGDLFLKHQLHQLLGGRGHIFEALSKGNDRKTHALKILHHLHSTPTVEGDLPNIETLTQAFDELFDVAVMNNIALGGL